MQGKNNFSRGAWNCLIILMALSDWSDPLYFTTPPQTIHAIYRSVFSLQVSFDRERCRLLYARWPWTIRRSRQAYVWSCVFLITVYELRGNKCCQRSSMSLIDWWYSQQVGVSRDRLHAPLNFDILICSERERQSINKPRWVAAYSRLPGRRQWCVPGLLATGYGGNAI